MQQYFSMNGIRLGDYPVEIPEELESLIPGFVSRRFEDLNRMKSFLEVRNISEIAKHAHRIKGHGAGYGFIALSEVGRALEESAHNRDIPKVCDLIDNYEAILEEIRVNYLGGQYLSDPDYK